MGSLSLIILIASLLFSTGYILFRFLRKRADVAFEENQFKLRETESLKYDVVQNIKELILTLEPSFSKYKNELQIKQRELENTPFNKIHKNVSTRDSFERMRNDLLEFNSFVADIGINYISEDNIQILLNKLNQKL